MQTPRKSLRLSLKRRAGLTLIEAAMVLTILALVIGGVMLFYSSANTGRQESSAMSQLGSIQQAVRTAYAGQGTYPVTMDGASIATLLPSSMVNTSVTPYTLQSAYNSTIELTGAGSTFTVAFDNVPSSACLSMATSDLGRSTQGLMIGTTAAASVPDTPSDAQTLCGTSPVTMTWTFY